MNVHFFSGYKLPWWFLSVSGNDWGKIAKLCIDCWTDWLVIDKFSFNKSEKWGGKLIFSICSLIDFWFLSTRMAKVAKIGSESILTLIYLQTTDDTGSSESLVRLARIEKRKILWTIFSHRQITRSRKSGCSQPPRGTTKNWQNLRRNTLNWWNYRWVAKRIIKL